MYDLFLDAFDHPCFQDWNVILNCFDKKHLKKEPANWIIVKESPQIEILKRSHMYVCHGGLNSTLESALMKVPQVILP